MTDMVKLKKAIDDSGMTMTAIAKKGGIARETLYNRLNGIGEFTASEIVGLSYALKLTKRQRDEIFLTEKLNYMQLHRERRNKMNELQVFKNQEFGSVRTLVINSEPWFIGKDVAEALGYGAENKKSKALTNAIKDHVGEEDKRLMSYEEFKGYRNGDLKNISHYGVTIINESGLYALIFGSKLESAQKFKRWVTSEVLPALRKTGQYQVKELSGQELMAKALIEAQSVLAAKDKQIEEMKPKALFADAVATSHTSILVGELAKILKQNGIDMGQKRLFAWLREKGYLIKRQGTDYNMPTQKAMDLGLFEIKEGSYVNGSGVNITTKTPKVTGKGQQYFINKFLQ